MTLFLLNALCALGWAAMIGSFSEVTLLTGFVVGFAALHLTRSLYGETAYFSRVFSVTFFLLYFLYELLVSSIKVAQDVLRPRLKSRPGIVALPLDARSDAEITLLANIISLTPGTLSLDVSADRSTLYVHAMFADDPDAVRNEIKSGLERRLLEAMR